MRGGWGGLLLGPRGGGLGKGCVFKLFRILVEHLAGHRGAFGPPLSGYVFDPFALFYDLSQLPIPPRRCGSTVPLGRNRPPGQALDNRPAPHADAWGRGSTSRRGLRATGVLRVDARTTSGRLEKGVAGIGSRNPTACLGSSGSIEPVVPQG